MLDLHKLWEITGNSSPIKVPAKLKYLRKDLQDWCRHYDIPLNTPSRFPIDSRPGALAALAAQRGGKLPQFIETVLHAYFLEDRDIADSRYLGNLPNQLDWMLKQLLLRWAIPLLSKRLMPTQKQPQSAEFSACRRSPSAMICTGVMTAWCLSRKPLSRVGNAHLPFWWALLQLGVYWEL